LDDRLAPGHKLYDSDTNSTATVVSVHDDHVKIAREGDDGPTELPHDQAQEWANNHVVQAAASKAAAEVFVDLDLTDAGSFLNYRKFIKWWQTKTHSKGSLSARISGMCARPCRSLITALLPWWCGDRLPD
jgi:hypothetical protein